MEASEAQLAKLPPLFLNAAGLDPLLSDTLALVARLEAAETDYEFVLHEGLHHGFLAVTGFGHDAHRHQRRPETRLGRQQPRLGRDGRECVRRRAQRL